MHYEKNGEKEMKKIALLLLVLLLLCAVCGCQSRPGLFPDFSSHSEEHHAAGGDDLSWDVTDTTTSTTATTTTTETTTTTTETTTEATEPETVIETPTETTTKKTDNGSIKITSKLQHELNIYLSNFTEVGLSSFKGKPDSDELIWFGLIHNYLNNFSKTFEMKEVEVEDRHYNERISKKNINTTVKRFFNTTVKDSAFEKYDDYYDGYVYFEETGGWVSRGFAVADSLKKTKSNTYKVTFTIYDDGYFYAYDDIYDLSPKDMKGTLRDKNGDKITVRKTGTGSAVFTTSDINKHGKYAISSYTVD